MVDKTLITSIIVAILIVILYIEMTDRAKRAAPPKPKPKTPKPIPKVKEQKWGTSWSSPYYFRDSHEMGVVGTRR